MQVVGPSILQLLQVLALVCCLFTFRPNFPPGYRHNVCTNNRCPGCSGGSSIARGSHADFLSRLHVIEEFAKGLRVHGLHAMLYTDKYIKDSSDVSCLIPFFSYYTIRIEPTKY